MEHDAKQRIRRPDKVTHLYTQADRARKLASECGSQLVAELLEDHARLCEQNAELRRHRRTRRKEPA